MRRGCWGCLLRSFASEPLPPDGSGGGGRLMGARNPPWFDEMVQHLATCAGCHEAVTSNQHDGLCAEGNRLVAVARENRWFVDCFIPGHTFPVNTYGPYSREDADRLREKILFNRRRTGIEHAEVTDNSPGCAPYWEPVDTE